MSDTAMEISSAEHQGLQLGTPTVFVITGFTARLLPSLWEAGFGRMTEPCDEMDTPSSRSMPSV